MYKIIFIYSYCPNLWTQIFIFFLFLGYSSAQKAFEHAYFEIGVWMSFDYFSE